MSEKKYNFDRIEFYIMKDIPIFFILHLKIFMKIYKK
jgi:hypothetical protein